MHLKGKRGGVLTGKERRVDPCLYEVKGRSQFKKKDCERKGLNPSEEALMKSGK